MGSEAQAQGDDTIALVTQQLPKKREISSLVRMQKVATKVRGVVLPLALKQVRVVIEVIMKKMMLVRDNGGDDGSVAIGTNAYTGLNRTNAAVNSSVAIGAGVRGLGYRSVGADGKPLGVGTDADDNDKVLVKAFGGTTSTLGNYNNAGAASQSWILLISRRRYFFPS